MVMHMLQPFTEKPVTIDMLLGRDTPVLMEENARVDGLLGINSKPEATEDRLAAIYAYQQQQRERHG